jgi:hypothetical protein
MPFLTSFSAGCPVTSTPMTVTVPAVGRMSPAIAFSKVDFPAPLGPTMAVIAPLRATTLTPSMTGGPPYPAVSRLTSRTGATPALLMVTA